MSEKKPNILWLTYEDTSPQFVSCYGMTNVVTTPNIDKLAHEGVRFDNAFASAPVCSASRSAIITGVCNETTGLGHHRSKYPLPRDLIKGFPWYLQKAGYYTSNNAKTDYNIEEESDFIDETWHESSGKGHWRNRSGDQPFFSVFNFDDSHQSRTMTKPWLWYKEKVLDVLPEDQRIDPRDVTMPPIYRDNKEMKKQLSRVYNSLKLCDIRIKERIDQLAEDNLLDDTIIFCFADHGEGIPRGKCNGIGFGYRASFVAWVPEQFRHLCPWEMGSSTDELLSFEDLAPTMLALGGCDVPDYMTGRVFMGEKREEVPPYIFAARNRLDDTPDLCRSAMDGRFVYTRNYFPHLPVVKFQKYSDVGDILREIRRDYAAGKLNEIQAELVKPLRPREYLFDLKNDPWEVRNLVDDPSYAEDLRRMRKATRDHACEGGDVMFLPEWEMVERAAPAAPYEKRFDKAYNPLKKMLAAAELVGDPQALEEQVALLNDPIDMVRYWAALGLFAHSYAETQDYSALEEKITAALDDSFSLVRRELASALVKIALASQREPLEKAVSIICREIEEGNPIAAHGAVENIIYLPKGASYFKETVRRVQERIRQSGDVQNKGQTFPLQQALDIFSYLYDGEALIYPEDLCYEDPETRKLDWSVSVI